MGDDDTDHGFASPPCYAHELDPLYAGLPPAPDARRARDVARWRKAERQRLLAARRVLAPGERRRIAAAVEGHLETLLEGWVGSLQGRAIAGWWPIDAELDLRSWFADLDDRGARVAMPVVVAPNRPLAFRRWTRESSMEAGFWNVPVPAAGDWMVPEVVLAPIVGFDPACHRLGHGGGYYDRTLATARPRPIAIGVGLAWARLATIYPQPHDVAMCAIVTEEGIVTPAGPDRDNPPGDPAAR